MKARFRFLLVALFIILFFFPFQSAYATHDDFVVVGSETGASPNNGGPIFQIFGLDGNFRVGRFVLTPDITGFQIIQDVRAGGGQHERILVCGVESANLTRGPIIQLWERDGTQVFSKFVIGDTFTQLSCEANDVDGDGVEEITLVARETEVIPVEDNRGWIIQVFDQSGNLLQAKFILNEFITGVQFESGRD